MDSPVARGVAAAYDAVAATYDEQLRDELTAKPLDRALLGAVAELSAGRLADVGCGPGHVTSFLARRHPDVVGFDLSPAMIEIARSHAPQLSFTVGSMLDLPVGDGAWAAARVDQVCIPDVRLPPSQPNIRNANVIQRPRRRRRDGRVVLPRS